MSKAKIAILVGSDSDVVTMQVGTKILKELKIPYEFHIYSAHRTPKETLQFSQSAQKRGISVIIAGAGMAAHLAGVIASHTLLPVIGVPMEGKLQGLDALLSTVQMPKGIPVGTMAIGKTGAANGCLFAAQILALQDRALLHRLQNYRQKMTQEVLRKNEKLHSK
ncbi:MAG: 5-(carboxyamino)imidazole ribonucleotide mutase [Deltaproteobacteria bacterium GWA2_38_16]|nr:MAG: 5-(carboxyamino)imidazole ribonucleotide mutase [Deltaproteobacteria bacterium GWA2_38_16]OGQ02729.1 MAG: 5-(carboxyamino)imidazole ribonucleotide mutase [Deltaproteobacteria bacterium RIFCSPHIGHO2_02_FULL_38_15]OGQ31873.1 MAG: 5-(carboxyamino)imidazole ribonucleotide mutase [Deltaproteobacteria bacterium RIFCSPLOWO2_01_FULL_38_9]OGQ59087.1 MAG: 5-(carboxyamino)imidazole ribonucleotide mutase [Deltaproteobacteria bacterium RIFCSPLOWO2_12_FULL_38_8]HBQ20589.1 5-(carboxyamino)imidazole ri